MISFEIVLKIFLLKMIDEDADSFFNKIDSSCIIYSTFLRTNF